MYVHYYYTHSLSKDNSNEKSNNNELKIKVPTLELIKCIFNSKLVNVCSLSARTWGKNIYIHSSIFTAVRSLGYGL